MVEHGAPVLLAHVAQISLLRQACEDCRGTVLEGGFLESLQGTQGLLANAASKAHMCVAHVQKFE
eukprot:1147286-Pelagomonas_calceolata.AAC.2